MAFATVSLEDSERSKPITKSLNSFKHASTPFPPEADNGRVFPICYAKQNENSL